MKEQEIISAWKNNKEGFMFVPKEMQEWADARRIEFDYACSGERRMDANFEDDTVYRLRQDYELPKMTEAECVAFLKASTTAPSTWPKEVKEIGNKIWHSSGSFGELLFEWLYKGEWIGCSGLWGDCPHRLKADVVWPPKSKETSLLDSVGWFTIFRFVTLRCDYTDGTVFVFRKVKENE
jgi:hypothetical protein